MKIIGFFNEYNEAEHKAKDLHLKYYGIQNLGNAANQTWVLVRLP